MRWTVPLKQLAQARWDEGASASIIAQEMGVTRNSIIGMIHRAGLSRSPHLVRECLRYGSLNHKRRRRIKLVKPMKALPSQSLAASPLPFWKLPKSGACRWCVEDFPRGSGDTALFCANETADGAPYCPGHAKRAFQPAQARRAA